MNKKTLTWIYSQSKTGDFGFVDVPGLEKWFYVFPFNKKDALDWDEVEAEIKVFKWKEEAVIKKIIKRSEKILIWEFEMWKSLKFWFVKLKDPAFRKDIFIPWKFIKKAKNTDIVWVIITKWEGKNPEGKIQHILWKSWEKWLEVEGFILESWFIEKFPESVEREVKNIHKNIKIHKNRQDLRKLFTFTIDWEDAKDLDDAISVKKQENWDYKLYVHIADVAHYIQENSELDKEAFERGTSVYLADRVIPMLPEKLSNDLCSLNPNTDKLTLTCEMLISSSWNLKETNIYESIINSDVRLTYKWVDEIIKWIWKYDEKLIQIIKNADSLKKIIARNKEISGVLNFDFPETKVILDEDKNVVEIKEYPRYDSNKTIEEFMIMANYAVSKQFSSYPFLYRIHEDPSWEGMEKLQKVLDLFGIKFKFKKFNTKEFSQLLELLDSPSPLKGEGARGWGYKPILEKIILRTLSKAIYSPENLWHFWLWIDFYSHFTSPIRRYPDLQIHRIIKEKINKKLDKKRINHYKDILKLVAIKCSDQEKKAERLEYKVRDYFIVDYYSDKVWEEFVWNITTIMKNWFFIALSDTSEGFVEIKKWESFEELQEYRDLSTWKKYILWEKVKIKLIEADMEKIRLNFALI